MNVVLRRADQLAAVLSSLSAILAAMIAGFILLATFMRYLVGAPLPFTEELVGLLFTAMVFAGLPAITLRGRHISVTLVADRLPLAARQLMRRAASGGTLVFCLWFGWLSWDYLMLAVSFGARTEATRLLIWPWAAVMPLSCALAAVAAALRIIVPIGHDPHSEEGTI